MIERQNAIIRGDWHDIRLEGWVIEGYDRLFQEPEEANAASTQSGKAAVPVFTVTPQAPIRRHRFVGHPKYPWFCKYCGYAPNQESMHLRSEECTA